MQEPSGPAPRRRWARRFSRGVNFSVFSARHACRALLFDDRNAAEPSRIIPLDAVAQRSYHYWHAFVPGLEPEQVYAYRARGPFAPERGLRFDHEKLLLDPYGLVVAVPDAYDRVAARRPGQNTAVAMKSVVADPGRYDWKGAPQAPVRRDRDLRAPRSRLHAASIVGRQNGTSTYAGLIEKIPTSRIWASPPLSSYRSSSSIRRTRRPARSTTGLPARFLLRASSRLQFAWGTARRSR